METTRSYTVKIDKTAPVITCTLSGSLFNGWYTGAVLFNITAVDQGSGLASLQYSLDNTTWSQFTDDFFVTASGARTIYYRAWDNMSKIAYGSTTVYIDNILPSTVLRTIGTAGLNGWYVSPVEFNLTASDALSGMANSWYDYDGVAPFNRYTGNFTNGTDGTWTLYYFSQDNANNNETRNSSAFKVDRTAPSTSHSLLATVGDNGWYRSDVRITLTPSDTMSGVLNTYYSFNNALWYRYTSAFNVSTTGTTIVYYKTQDRAGNNETAKNVSFKIDRAAPASSFTVTSGALGHDNWYRSDVLINLTATDDMSGVAGIRYCVNGGSWTTYSVDFWINTEGNDTIEYYAIDDAGNSESTNSRTVKIDKTPPLASSSLSGSFGTNGWYTSDVALTVIRSDDRSGIWATRYSFNNAAWSAYTVPITLSNNGANTLYYSAEDYAGNLNNTSRAVNIDKTLPVTTPGLDGTMGGDGWYTTNVVVTLTASDSPSGVYQTWYSYDNMSWDLYGGPFTVNAEGLTIVYFYSVDNAGNTEATTRIILAIDKTAPETSIMLGGTPGSAGWWLSGVTVTLSALDQYSSVGNTEYSFDGTHWTYGTSLTLPDDGIFTVYYRSSDRAGNLETYKTQVVKIDTVAPETTIALDGVPGNGGWFRSNVTVTLTGNDTTSGVTYAEYSFDNASWDRYDAPFIVSTEGNTTLYYRSNDTAGNLEATDTMSLSIDRTPPSVASTLPANGYKYGRLDCSILVTFSEPLDPANVSGSIVVRDWHGANVPGTITYMDNTMTFDPMNILGPDFEYTVIVSGAVTDIVGNPMGAGYTFRFKAIGVHGALGNHSLYQDQTNSTNYLDPSPSPMVTPTPVQSVTPTPTVAPAVTPTPTPTPTPTADPSSDNTPLYLGMLVVFLGILAVAGAAVYFLVLRK